MRRYYLSKFDGPPYQPYVARFGRYGFLDYRPNQALGRGWCVACVEGDELPDSSGFQFLADVQYLALCDDPNVPLGDELRGRIRRALDLQFSSLTLKDIIVETQLRYSDIRPESSGDYRITL